MKSKGGLTNEPGKHFPSLSPQVRNLAVILDFKLCLTKQIHLLVKSSFYQIQNISELKIVFS